MAEATTLPNLVYAVEAIDAVGQMFQSSSFRESNACNALGLADWPTIRLRQRIAPILLRRVAEPTPMNLLIRWFVLNQPISVDLAEEKLGADKVAALLETGLLTNRQAMLSANFEVCALSETFVVCDWPTQPPNLDEVMTVSAATRILAQTTVTQAGGRVLDLGSGSGIQSLLASRRGASVVGVDCNPRAVNLAKFNARLNACSGTTFRVGDFFTLVDSERFDLIVSCPPFVISPDVSHTHSHSGNSSDALAQRLLVSASARLAPGGFLQIVCHWIEKNDQDWRRRLMEWIQPTKCDALVLYSHGEDPITYAFDRIAETNAQGVVPSELLDAWLDSFATQQIAKIWSGILTLRAPTSEQPANHSWIEFERFPAPGSGIGYGEYVKAFFETREFLTQASTETAMLETTFRPAERLILRHEQTRDAGKWGPSQSLVGTRDGMISMKALDPSLIQLLDLFGDGRPAKTVLDEFAKSRKQTAGALTPRFVEAVRVLVQTGYLRPADASTVRFDSQK